MRETIDKILDRLLGRRLAESSLPVQALLTLRHQPGREILQALYGVPYQAGGNLQVIDDIPALYDTRFSVAVEQKVRRVLDTAEGKELPFEEREGRVEFSLPKFWCHSVVLIEY